MLPRVLLVLLALLVLLVLLALLFGTILCYLILFLFIFILSSAVPGLFGSCTICKIACNIVADAVCICLLDFISAYLKVTVFMCFCRNLENSPAATYIFSYQAIPGKVRNVTYCNIGSDIFLHDLASTYMFHA